MKRIFHIVLSFWLSLLLLFGSTAMEYIHLFTGHQDTVHHDLPDGGLVMESQHHHCTFLSFSLPAFLDQPIEVPVYYTREIHLDRSFGLYQVCFREQSILPSFRGPPIA